MREYLWCLSERKPEGTDNTDEENNCQIVMFWYIKHWGTSIIVYNLISLDNFEENTFRSRLTSVQKRCIPPSIILKGKRNLRQSALNDGRPTEFQRPMKNREASSISLSPQAKSQPTILWSWLAQMSWRASN